MPRLHAPKLFMGAASVGMHGVMQADIDSISTDAGIPDEIGKALVTQGVRLIIAEQGG